MTDPQIFESMQALQAMLAEHVKAVRREQADELRKLSTQHSELALKCYGSIEEQARLLGMAEAYAAAAVYVEWARFPKLEAV